MKPQDSKILKVSQVNSLVREILETSFTSFLVAGEISNLAEPSSGHIYFSLKDELAQVRAVMFRHHKTTLKFPPQNGAHVIATAKVGLYEPRGDYQLIVERMEPAGIGVLHARFLQLKTMLAAEGLFAAEYKKPLPRLPHCIGVITSPTGAVIRDILSVLKRRCPGVQIIIYPVLVQGSEAVAQIVQALQKANTRRECELLILARGGGSLEDLWPFNEEIVARAIFKSVIPIVSAIGHETDFTIADFVADVRAPTPSIAAEIAAPDMLEWGNNYARLQRQLVNLIKHKLQEASWLVVNLHKRLRHPRHYLMEKIQRLDEFEHRLRLAIKQQQTSLQQRLANVIAALDVMSPLATLARGYAVISNSNNGKIIYKSVDVSIGDQIQAQLADGELECLVKRIKS